MVESGEWDRCVYRLCSSRLSELNAYDKYRLSATLSQRLAETGWADEVHHHSKGLEAVLRLSLRRSSTHGRHIEIAKSAGPQSGKTARQIMTDVQQHAEGMCL